MQHCDSKYSPPWKVVIEISHLASFYTDLLTKGTYGIHVSGRDPHGIFSL